MKLTRHTGWNHKAHVATKMRAETERKLVKDLIDIKVKKKKKKKDEKAEETFL